MLDRVHPTVTGVLATGSTQVRVTFSEAVDNTTANAFASYAIVDNTTGTPLSVTGAARQEATDNASVLLTTASQAGGTPDVINFKMGAMTLAFQHKKHLTALNNECFHCHKTENGKIDDWGKETAHTICIPCHDLYEKGPTECKGCHKK